MKIKSDSFLLNAVLLVLASALIWGLLSWSNDPITDDDLKNAYGKELLTSQDEELLDSILLCSENNLPDSVSPAITSNRFVYQVIIDKLIKRALYLRYEEKRDGAAVRMADARKLAAIYSQVLSDRFFEKKVAFCDSLQGHEVRLKLKAELLYSMARSYHWKDEFETARHYYQNSLSISQKIKDLALEVDNLTQLQHIQYAQGKYDAALLIGKEVKEKATRIGYLRRIISCYYNNGLTYIESGDANLAEIHLKAGFDLAINTNDKEYLMILIGQLANVYRRLGQSRQALNAYNIALEYSRKFEDKRVELLTLNNRYLVYRNMGNYAMAQKDLKKALQIANETKAYNKAIILFNLGEISRILGDYNRGLDYLDSSIVYKNSMESYYDIARIYNVRGNIYSSLDLHEKAIKDFQEGLQIIRLNIVDSSAETKPRTLEAEFWLRIADTFIKQQKWNEAYNYCEKALDAFTQLAYQKEIVNAHIRMGQIFRNTGDYEKAKSNLDTAFSIADQLKDPMLLAGTYYEIGLVYCNQGQTKKAVKMLALAINEIESTRMKIEGEDRLSYFSTMQSIYDEKILLHFGLTEYDIAFQFSEQARARFMRELFENENDDDSTKIFTPVNLYDFQQQLDDSIQIVEFKVTPEKLLIFLIDRNEFFAVSQEISKEKLENLVLDFKFLIGAESDSVFFERVSQDSRSIYNQSLELSTRLYELLILPVADKLEPEKIIYFVPDDFLFGLPFTALAARIDDKEQFFVEKFTSARAPSAYMVNYFLSNRKPVVGQERMKFLGIGNPTGDLSAAEKEVNFLASKFSDFKIFIHTHAKKKAIINTLRKKDNHVVHIAAHAEINYDSPLESYLRLFPDRDNQHSAIIASNGKYAPDSDLTAREIFEIDLSQVRLFNLAACKTASGRYFRGEGIVGLNTALLKAGASSVISSLWNVNDKYTNKLMKAFYEYWIEKKMNKATALRQAQLQVIAEMRSDKFIANSPHPFAWASFILVGEFQADR
jgi:CHAT domain-containing protein/uncharacterized protein HemY